MNIYMGVGHGRSFPKEGPYVGSSLGYLPCMFIPPPPICNPFTPVTEAVGDFDAAVDMTRRDRPQLPSSVSAHQ